MTDETLEEFASHEERNVELRQANARLSQQLAQAKRRNAELIDAVYRAARDAAAALTLPPVDPPTPDKRKRTGEVAIAVLSDWQLAKITPDYSSEVCEERIRRYADKVIELVNIQRADHPVRELRVYLLGDMVEGEMIFPGQSHLIDASLFRQTMIDGPRILGDFIRRMSRHFDKVHVAGVIGNHGAIGGRARKDFHPETNADSILYEFVREITENKRVTWAPTWTAGESHWYLIDKVGDKRFFLFHGNQVRGVNGVPWYGFDRKVKGWFTAFHLLRDKEGFDYALSGHFHTPFREYINGITHWGNGTTESYNTYALQELAAAGEPAQWLLFCHPKRGVTAEYLVSLK